MQTNHKGFFVVFILGGLLFAAATIPAAYAFDATGTWEGRYKCSESFDGESSSFKEVGVMEISQVGDELRVSVDSGEFRYTGLIINDANKPDRKAQAGLVGCTTTSSVVGLHESEIIRVRLTGQSNSPSNPNALLRGRSVYTGVWTDDEKYVGDCTWQYKRTSLADPGVGSCP